MSRVEFTRLLFGVLAGALCLCAPCVVRAGGEADPAVPSFQILDTDTGLSLHEETYMAIGHADRYNGRQSELIFQISAKHRIFGTRLYFAYTQISFWQALDIENSSPFRDTNYNPEVFWRFLPRDFLQGRLAMDAGFEHESNGQGVPKSRSWNQIYLTPAWQRGRLLLRLKARWRIPEDAKETPTSALGDDNPDITDFMGYSDLIAYYRFPNRHQIHFLVRGNPATGKGAVSLNYTVPVPGNSTSFFILRLFHGYGESLLDYDQMVSRVSAGLSFSR